MNLQQLEYLIAVDKTGSFSKAADLCHVTQATLSTMIKRLEEELDLVLFDRKTNPVLTTDSARPILVLARQAVEAARRIKEISGNESNRVVGGLKMGVIPTIANSVLPLIMKPLLQEYPQLKLEVREITTQSILKQLRSGEIDVGLVSTPVKGDEDFEKKVLYYEALFVYGTPASKKKKFLMPKELVHDKIWLLEEGHCLRDQFVNLCSLNKKRLGDQFVFESGSFDTLLSMADQFGGLTVVPELYVKTMAKERRSKIYQFVSPYPVREVSLLINRPHVKAQLVSVLIAEIKKAVMPLLMTNEVKKSEQVIVKT
jgi:LysR family hydrogen peroxide-inducible transcriptional activator